MKQRTEYESIELSRLTGMLERELVRRGVSVETILTHTFDSDRERFEAWAVESMLFSARQLRIGDRVAAMRGLFQAFEYRGRLGGFMPGPHLSDALAELKSQLELSI